MKCSGSLEGLLDWAVAARPFPGQVVSGDLHLVAPFSGGAVLAVVDGLGHGPDAEISARAALAAVEQDPSSTVETLMTRSHRALDRLRGVVMSLVSFDAEARHMTWLGVGNVEGTLFHVDPATQIVHRERLLVWGGVVGQTLPRLRPATLPVADGDTLVLATDGLRAQFLDDLRVDGMVEDIAHGVLTQHAKSTDDALVLVARYRGGHRP